VIGDALPLRLTLELVAELLTMLSVAAAEPPAAEVVLRNVTVIEQEPAGGIGPVQLFA